MPKTLHLSALAITAAVALALTGCAPATTDDAASTDTISIDHAFGTTEVPADAERVVTYGWGSADAAIALGVVPVAIPFQSYGGDENGVLPWISEALDEMGEEIPTVLPDSSEEPPYDEIAEADPDVILAVYSGITEEQYELLSAIAPTVAYPDEAWSTPWRDVVTTVGKALNKDAEAVEVLADIDEELAAQAAAHPEFAGKSIAAVWDVAGTFYVYKDADPRVEFLFDLGFTNPESVDALANGDSTFYYTLSYEQLDKLESDVVLSYSDTQEEADAFVTSSYGLAIPAVASGNVATAVGTKFIAAVSPPTALSLPWGLDELIAALEVATK